MSPMAVAIVWSVDLPKIGLSANLMLRFKSKRAVDEMIATLEKHRDGVWPPT